MLNAIKYSPEGGDTGIGMGRDEDGLGRWCGYRSEQPKEPTRSVLAALRMTRAVREGRSTLPEEHREVERYTCHRELLPVIESALAAQGYVLEAPLQPEVGGSRLTVMTRGGSVISLHEDTARDMANISVYHNEGAGPLSILDELSRLAAPPITRATRR